ncbi:N5-glutamine S-adenosyl-L-methionine-dependent methyltransferase [Botrimarina colliarenosi]|uniref:N5-glutamine S-adenosyl-L-methionine-dependent methyltransferase n=1 Tax=Botrimarina colliarenosi TaxID=2528001 RepID=A0A5C6AAZ2_9BACT|nr:class I SAM-dependent methyltransferase [Botrimarina colliarenosi]TWT96739.1 N5-glutamine S-adenosyl-L-methionine-dependent methyltransferase [Botrimarina colliarenosi]
MAAPVLFGMSTATYRWNARQAAADYDAAGPVIHPHYDEMQQAVVAALPFDIADTVHVVDLGGGSGRLAERVLDALPNATVTIVDPSEAFLEIASKRHERFTGRAHFVPRRAQDDWREAVARPDAIVSTSALHHLDAGEKNQVFAACRSVLSPGGVFVNGDEYRPPSDATYREWLEEWGEHMRSAVATGRTPATFGEIVDRWQERNLADFGGQRESGDDCHETVEEQAARLYGAGFRGVETTWRHRLWAVLVATP